MYRYLLVAVLLLCVETAAANIELVMPPTSVSPTGDRATFSTPMDYLNGHLAVVQVEAADDKTPSGYLRTVVHHGKRESEGSWRWTSTVIERRTLHDPYHTQPSVAFDRDGYLHVVYNMHHVPWQYLVSSQPYQITSFAFGGEAVTLADLDLVRKHNQTHHFTSNGKALIPGNQITYPAFTKDRHGDLYVTYRYATKPARRWEERAFAIGIAKYDTLARRWQPLAEPLSLNQGDALMGPDGRSATHPFIFDEFFLPYLVTLAFDQDNTLHAIWTWWDRKRGLDGSHTFTPSYRNVAVDSLPVPSVNAEMAERIPGWPGDTVFNTAKALDVAANGDLLAIFEVKGKSRYLIRRSREGGHWGRAVETPNSASKIKVSNDGTEWLFASGITVFRRSPGGSWSKAAQIGQNLCDPWPVYVPDENLFFIRAKNCTDFSSSVVFSYQPDLP